METLMAAEMELVNIDAEERFLTFAFIFQSNDEGCKLDCQWQFGRDIALYPANRQEALKEMNAFKNKQKPPSNTTEGSNFTTHGQASGGSSASTQNNNNNGKAKAVSFDPSYWDTKTCYVCNEKGHPSYTHGKTPASPRSKGRRGRSRGSPVKTPPPPAIVLPMHPRRA